MVDLVWRLAVQRHVRSRFVVPIDNALDLALELRLILWNDDQTQDFFHRAMKAFDNSNGPVPADSAETIPNVPGFAPNVSEVLAVELGSLVNNKVFGPDLLSVHDSIQRGSHFLGHRSALEDGEPNGAS